MRGKETESGIQRAILDFLAASHVFAFRLNTSTHIIETKGKKRLFRSHSLGPGAADILAVLERVCGGMIYGHRLLWIEVKSATGEQTGEQKSFQYHVESMGHSYLLANSVEKVKEVLREL